MPVFIFSQINYEKRHRNNCFCIESNICGTETLILVQKTVIYQAYQA